jgi:hypothetical protein
MKTNYYLHINEGGLSSPYIINLKEFGIDNLLEVDFNDRPEKIINALDDFLDWSKSSWEDLECCDIVVSNPDREEFLKVIPFQLDSGARGIETRQDLEDRVFIRNFILVDEDVRKSDPTVKAFYEVSDEYLEYYFNIF